MKSQRFSKKILKFENLRKINEKSMFFKEKSMFFKEKSKNLKSLSKVCNLQRNVLLPSDFQGKFYQQHARARY